MRIKLIQPNLDLRYSSLRQGYNDVETRPPETGLAVLSSWIESYATSAHEVIVLDPRKDLGQLAKEGADCDLLGITDWFSNHLNSTDLIEKAKIINPRLITVLGGPNASLVAKETFLNHPSLDFIVGRDGEEALLALSEGKTPPDIPNLWFRGRDGKIKFSFQSFAPLDKMPLWDFKQFQSAEDRMRKYLVAQNSGEGPWMSTPLTLFSFRGCPKAMREGLCTYCTSAETKGRALSPERFWDQILNLQSEYGAKTFYMADDIFTISPKRIEDIANKKPNLASPTIRAYGYLPDLARLQSSELEQMAENLGKIGVFNLFYGEESYDPDVLRKVNKKGVGVEDTIRVIKTLKEKAGIKATIAYLLGLPGVSKESLERDAGSFERLLDADDCIERLAISPGVPLKGTPWYKILEQDTNFRKAYRDETGRDVVTDDYPDYTLMSHLSVRYTTSVTVNQVNNAILKMVELAERRLGKNQVGGFLLEAINGKEN